MNSSEQHGPEFAIPSETSENGSAPYESPREEAHSTLHSSANDGQAPVLEETISDENILSDHSPLTTDAAFAEAAPALDSPEAAHMPVDQVAQAPVPEEQLPEGEGLLSVIQSLAVTIVIAVFVITFIVQAFQIPSESMEDTLLIGDYLLVDKAHFGPAGIWSPLMPYSKVKRGDIVVFRYPVHPSQHFVKRVIGVPGDRVKLVHKKLFINGAEVPEDYVVYKRHDRDSFRDNFPTGDSLSPSIDSRWYLELRRLTENGQLIVPAGFYFVMGDNREESLDSRYWGFVPQENIIGRPLIIYWSVQRTDQLDEPFHQSQDGKLTRFARTVVDAVHNLRWHRTFRLVR